MNKIYFYVTLTLMQRITFFGSFPKVMNNSHQKYFFFIMQNMAYINYVKAKEKKYLNRSNHRCRARDRKRFVKEQLDTSDTSNVKAREFKEFYQLTRKSFYKLYKLIKDHPIFH